MRIYLIGHRGWIGQMISDYCKEKGIEIVSGDFRGESQELLKDIKNKNVSHVFCCLGRTHGTYQLKKGDRYEDWIIFVQDRPYNDKRYFISNEKLKQLGWKQKINFMDGLMHLL
jgi:dTDP-D-glucose 4,6-dehydratase